MRTPRLIALAVLLSSFLFVVPAAAQTINGSISGLVTDTNDAAVPAASIKVTNVDTGATRDTVTGTDGFYRVVGFFG